jgi:hypothetical protein
MARRVLLGEAMDEIISADAPDPISIDRCPLRGVREAVDGELVEGTK